MPSLVVDRGPVLRVLGWALTRMRNIFLLVQRIRDAQSLHLFTLQSRIGVKMMHG